MWFDIQDGGPIDGVKAFHDKTSSFYGHESANGGPYSIGPPLGPLSEDAQPGIAAVSARMARTGFDLGGIGLVEMEEHFDVGKVFKTEQGFRRETILVQVNTRRNLAPFIIYVFPSTTPKEPNGCHFNFHGLP
jgi:hypothetical protein